MSKERRSLMRPQYRPDCPEHLVPMRVRTSKRIICYMECPVPGCRHRKIVPLEETPKAPPRAKG